MSEKIYIAFATNGHEEMYTMGPAQSVGEAKQIAARLTAAAGLTLTEVREATEDEVMMHVLEQLLNGGLG